MTSIPLRARTIELWGEHNPGLDTAPMELVAQVKRISSLLDLAVEPIYDGAAVTSAEVGLLVPLRHLDEPVTAIRLAARLGMSRAGVSKTLAKLERRGLIDRVVNPADRRAALITVTEEGKAVIDDVFPRELAAHGKLFSGLGKDHASVLAALTRLAEVMEASLGGER